MKLRIALAVLFIGACPKGFAQNYNAIHGSSYGASLNVSNNPATIVNTPVSWDLTLFGFQEKSVTNAFTIYNYSLLSSPAKSEYALDEGNYGRKADLNFNVNLLNTRIALNRRSAIAFGANMRGYVRLRTDPYNYVDTILDVSGFIQINDPQSVLQGKLKSSSWIELFGTYSQTVWDNEQSRLNAGVTLKVNRGLSGIYANLQNVGVTTEIQPGSIDYYLRSGSATYGYSSNYDRWQDNKSSSQNITDFAKYTEGGASIDLGAELLIKTQAVTSFRDEDDGYYEYEWKIGLSLLDIGQAQFKYGTKSRAASNPRTDISADDLQFKFQTVADVQDFNDSLATIVNSFSVLNGNYSMVHPARMVLNVDKYLAKNIYLNGELSLNLSPLAGDKRMYVQELNLLTITPRWETKRWGAYLPVQFNNVGKFWVGAAFKAGPVLLGIHNFANLFAKSQMQNGGGYLALVFHSWKNTKEERYKKVDCFR